MKISVASFIDAVNRAGHYVGNGYRLTYSSWSKIVLTRLPNPKFAKLPEEITIKVKS